MWPDARSAVGKAPRDDPVSTSRSAMDRFQDGQQSHFALDGDEPLPPRERSQ
jgi:hypothetical protein